MKNRTLLEKIALKAFNAGYDGRESASDPGIHAGLFKDDEAWEVWAREYERGQRAYCADGMSDLWTGRFN